MAMYNKFITFFVLTFIVSFSYAQQYTPMTAAGYQYKRAKVDSTLHIPSFCGVPNLRNSTAINGALAMDTCANKLYQWTNSAGWSIISGAGGGGGTLQSVTDSGNTTTNDIQLLNHARVILGDSGEILLDNGSKLRMGAIDAQTGGSKGIAQICAVGYELKWEGGSLYIMNDQGFTVREVRYKFSSIPTATDDGSKGFYPGSRWVLDNGTLYTCTDSTSGAAVWQNTTYPSLNDVATVGNFYANDLADTLRLNSYDAINNIKHPILWTNDFYGGSPNNILDFSYGSGNQNVAQISFGDASSTLGNGFIKITDKESVFKNELSTRTIIQNEYSGSVTQTTHFPLMKGTTDTLATLDDIRNSAIDTSNRFVNDVVKKNDSTITVYKGSTATDITLTPSTTVASASRLVTTVYNNSGSTITKGSVIYINGRHSSNLPTIALAQANSEDNSYATFALVQDDITNNNSGTIIQAGNISNLNLPTASFADGEVVYLSPTVAGGLTTNKTSVLAPNHIVKIGTITRAHPTFGSIEIRIENGWQLDELSDVQIPIVPNDSTLLQFSRVDSLWHSVGITNAIGSNYLKPTDSATMLTPYLRKVDTTNRFVNNISRTVGKDSIIFNIGSTRYAIKDSVGGGGSAAGSTGNVQYNNGGAFAGSNNLFWDNTNTRLGIGTASPATTLNLIGTNPYNALRIGDGTGYVNQQYNRGATGSWLTQTTTASTGLMFEYSHATNPGFNFLIPTIVAMGFGMDNTGMFMSNTNSSYPGSILLKTFNGGNVAIGTNTNAGFKLDVNGTARAVTSLQTPTLLGNTTSGANLTLQSTSNATKGKLLFGTSAYDEVNNRLGIGTASPAYKLDCALFNGNAVRLVGGVGFNNGFIQTSYSNFLFSSNTFFDTIVGSFKYEKAGFAAAVQAESSTGNILFNTAPSGSAGANATLDNRMIVFNAGNVAIGTNPTNAGYKFDVNGTARVQGALNFNPTNTASGTTGNQTINKASGTVNIAAAGTTVTVTNSLVTASSIVYAVIRTNDATATIKNVVPAAGSFTINLGAAATAETSIGFFVIN